MSALYFRVGLLLANAEPENQVCYINPRTFFASKMSWTHRAVLMTYVSNKLYRRLGQK